MAFFTTLNMQPNALVPHFALAWGYLVARGLVSLLCGSPLAVPAG